MKTKRWVALALAFLMTLTLASVALAAPSPQGWTIRGVTDNVKEKQIEATTIKSAKAVEDLRKAAAKFAAEKFANDPDLKDGFDLVELTSADVRITITGNKPGKVELKVPNAKAGEKIFVVVRYPNGKTEIVEGAVTADGIVAFEVTGNCSISVMKVIKKGEKYTTGGGIVLPAR